MMFKTHVAFGVLLGLVIMPYLKPESKLIFLLIAAFAAGIPDTDSPKSKFGRKIKIIGWIFEHRGIFHSFFAVVLFSLLFFAIFRNIAYSGAFLIGYLSHIIADSLNVEGIMPLYPLTKARLRGFTKTGGLVEGVLFIILLIFIALIAKSYV